MKTIQDKIYGYFERNSLLKVLFIFKTHFYVWTYKKCLEDGLHLCGVQGGMVHG